MRKFSDEEIIEKARSKVRGSNEIDINKNPVDVTVDLQDEHDVTHSYVVSFKRDAGQSEQEWTPIEISEISTW